MLVWPASPPSRESSSNSLCALHSNPLSLSPRLALPQAKVWLERFSQMDRDRDGYVTGEDFCHYLAVPSDACSQAVFQALRDGVSWRTLKTLCVNSLSAGA